MIFCAFIQTKPCKEAFLSRVATVSDSYCMAVVTTRLHKNNITVISVENVIFNIYRTFLPFVWKMYHTQNMNVERCRQLLTITTELSKEQE